VESKPVRKKYGLVEGVPHPFIAEEIVAKMHVFASLYLFICPSVITRHTMRKISHEI
jgi:hypothetical protein